jgi:hypothetical protein
MDRVAAGVALCGRRSWPSLLAVARPRVDPAITLERNRYAPSVCVAARMRGDRVSRMNNGSHLLAAV